MVLKTVLLHSETVDGPWLVCFHYLRMSTISSFAWLPDMNRLGEMKKVKKKRGWLLFLAKQFICVYMYVCIYYEKFDIWTVIWINSKMLHKIGTSDGMELPFQDGNA